jgi:hypothetical protein
MISDVLWDAVNEIDSYLTDDTFATTYEGEIRERIVKMRDENERSGGGACPPAAATVARVMRQFGDLVALGDVYTPRALKALRVVGKHLHTAAMGIKTPDGFAWRDPQQSKKACIWMSHAVARFFTSLGFEAGAVPVMFRIEAPNAIADPTAHEGKRDHILSIGDPARETDEHREAFLTREGWNGHMVCLVMGDKPFIVDATLYNCTRASWPSLSPMVAVPSIPQETMIEDLPVKVVAALSRATENWSCVWTMQPVEDDRWTSSADLSRGFDKATANKLKSKFLRGG